MSHLEHVVDDALLHIHHHSTSLHNRNAAMLTRHRRCVHPSCSKAVADVCTGCIPATYICIANRILCCCCTQAQCGLLSDALELAPDKICHADTSVAACFTELLLKWWLFKCCGCDTTHTEPFHLLPNHHTLRLLMSPGWPLPTGRLLHGTTREHDFKT